MAPPVDLHAIEVNGADVQDSFSIAGPLPNLGGKVVDLSVQRDERGRGVDVCQHDSLLNQVG